MIRNRARKKFMLEEGRVDCGLEGVCGLSRGELKRKGWEKLNSRLFRAPNWSHASSLDTPDLQP